jgi:hypothetical protein
LFAVSQVCSAWRAASSTLPQWALIPKLCRAPALRPRFSLHPDVEWAMQAATTRAEVAAVLPHFPVQPSWTMRPVGLVLVYVANALLAIAWAVGCSVLAHISSSIWIDDPDNQVDDLVPGCFVGIVMVATPLAQYSFWVLHSRTSRGCKATWKTAVIHRAAHTPFAAAMLVITVVLSIPFGLTSSRALQASLLMNATSLSLRTADGNCTRTLIRGWSPKGYDGAPVYVVLDRASDWRLRPFAPLTTEYDPVCTGIPTDGMSPLSDVAPTWWVDAYRAWRAQHRDRSNWTCTATEIVTEPSSDGVKEFKHYMAWLWPPPRCATLLSAVAVVYDPTTPDFDAFIGRVWSSPSNGSIALRAPVPDGWFRKIPPSGLQSWRWWYNGGPWTKSVTPIVEGRADSKAHSLHEHWFGVTAGIAALAVAILVVAGVAATRSFITASPRPGDMFAEVLVVVAMNPLWAIGFGIGCRDRSYDDVCMTASWVLWCIVGLSLGVTFIFAVGTCSSLLEGDLD